MRQGRLLRLQLDAPTASGKNRLGCSTASGRSYRLGQAWPATSAMIEAELWHPRRTLGRALVWPIAGAVCKPTGPPGLYWPSAV